MNRLDGAPTLPIKDDTDLAVEALAQQILRDYDVTPQQAMQMARSQVMQTQDEQAQSGFDSPEARLAQSHADAGASPERAARRAANQVQTYGPTGAAGLAAEYETPEGMSRLQQAQAEIDADDARHQQMYDDYFRGSASPTHWSVPPEEAKRDEYNERKRGLRQSYMRDGLHPQQVVDPVDPNFVSRGQQEEADRKAERDAHMEGVFKNIRQKYGADEEAAARAAYAEGKVHVPQPPHQRSMNEARRNLEMTAMKGGDNSDDARQRLRAMEAGVNYDDLTPDQKDALRAPGGNMSETRRKNMTSRLRVQAGVAGTPDADGKSADQLRELIAAKRADEAKAREAMWRPRLMMQRGNAVGALAVPGLNDWQRQFIAGGPTPLTVEAAHNAQLTQLGLQVAQGRGFQQPQMTPEQRQMADVAARKAEEELPAEAAAQRERDRNNGVLPAESSAGRKMLQKIDNEVIGFIASQSEIDTAVEEAVRNGIPEADARAYFGRRKNDFLFWNPDPYGLRNPKQE